MTYSDGKLLRTEITVILRRDVGAVQFVLSEGPTGFVISGMDRETKELTVTAPIENMDEAVERFKKEISK